MHLSRLSAVVVMGILISPAVAQPLPIATPADVGLSADRLQEMTNRLKAEVSNGQMPGGVVVIARRGKIAYSEAIGYQDPVKKIPMQKDAIFSIASMTKPMVSIAAMMLVEEGRLLLSDPIGKYLPSLADMKVGVEKVKADGTAELDLVAPKRPVTIRDLMSHVSGMPYGGARNTPLLKPWLGNSAEAALELTGPEFIEAVSKAPLIHQPGEVWEYGFSTDVLGLIIEKITGKSLSEVLADRIWKPIGMPDTSFSLPEAKRNRYALAFENDPTTGKPQRRVLHAIGPIKFDCGGGCAVTTAADYVRFGQMLLNNGTLDGNRYVSRKTIELMTSDQIGSSARAKSTSPIINDGYTFGLGFEIRSQAGMADFAGSLGDYDWYGAFGTLFWIDPKEQLVVVYMGATPGQARPFYRSLVRNLVMQSIVD